MQLIVSLMIGLPALFALAVGGYHLAYGRFFPYLPGFALDAYNQLVAASGASFRMSAILMLICGGLAFFFAFLMYPRRQAAACPESPLKPYGCPGVSA